ncbi:MAG: hypothetical protein ACYTGW_10795 [Planctomycetota bacterium]|jgi:hypothetical protein
MRQCPTPEGGPGNRPLIAHQITGGACAERQQEHYHKCHRCVFRGKGVEFVPTNNNPERNGGVMADRGGELKRDRLRVEETVELPSRNGVPAESTVTPARAPTPTPTLTPDKA